MRSYLRQLRLRAGFGAGFAFGGDGLDVLTLGEDVFDEVTFGRCGLRFGGCRGLGHRGGRCGERLPAAPSMGCNQSPRECAVT